MTEFAIEQPIAFVGLDIETTGLSPESEILEVGVVFFTPDLLPVFEHTEYIVTRQTADWLADLDSSPIDEFVKNMHAKTGLWDELTEGIGNGALRVTEGYAEADEEVAGIIDYALGRWPSRDGKYPILGSSVHFDRRLMEGRFPKTLAKFSHRHVDASSFAELLRSVDEDSYDLAIEETDRAVTMAELVQHRATSDVVRSALLIKAVCFYGGLGDKFLYPDDHKRVSIDE